MPVTRTFCMLHYLGGGMAYLYYVAKEILNENQIKEMVNYSSSQY